jgi:Ca2+-transporting ATPase
MPAGVAVTFLLTLAVMYIPFIARLFELVPLQVTGWIVPVFVSFGVLAGIEVLKAGFFRNAD